MRQKEVGTISTSTTKILLIGLLLLTFVSTVSADYYYNNAGGISNNDYVSFPEYDSQRELAVNFVAPFLLITMILRIGLKKALMFTFDANNNHPIHGSDKQARKQASKYSTVMSLLITGMLVPTPFFQNFDLWISAIFGGTIYLIFSLFLISVLYIIYRVVI